MKEPVTQVIRFKHLDYSQMHDPLLHRELESCYILYKIKNICK